VLLALAAAGCATRAPASDGSASAVGGRDAAPTAAPTSGADVLRLMHDRYAGRWYTTLTFTQATELRLANDSLAHETWYETAKIPGFLRIDRGARDGRNVILFRGDSTYSRRDGGPVRARRSRNELMTLGFDVYGQPADRSAAQLAEEGYDLARTGEASWQGRPVWVVGAATGDTVGPRVRRQFWVDKERLVFVRSLGPGLRDSTAAAEIVFGAYEPLAGGWIAKEVTVTEGGKVIQREVYSDVRANVPVEERLFDPAGMK
jgi:hypothetical protein